MFGADRFQLKRAIQSVKKVNNRPAQSAKHLDGRISRIEHRFHRSVETKKRRRENIPEISINENLPIAAKSNDIITAIKKHPVVIISGETGSGKTTQIPKLCLAAGRGIDGVIGCTQPRRIAAATVAARIAEELGEDLGQSVGYKIRFDEKTGRDNFIKIMTDGVLLAETQTDRFLNAYDTIIVDEAHERSLNIDFVLGILKTLVQKRNDLKLIITSATIDTEKFSKAFDNAPVIEVSGRAYPVKVHYWPVEEFDKAEDEATHVEIAVAAVDRIIRQGPFGDILVFMPTEQDIRDTCELLEDRKLNRVDILPLFARLSSIEQRKVFSNKGKRKIIVATNVAETSLTIPGIKYVVDTGLARMVRYSPRTRTTALPVESVSQSSADQRKGRSGRVQNGVCVRLYTEEDYLSRPLYTPPEILRSNLAEVILRMIFLKLGDIDRFPFIDRPASKSISDGFDLLKELGAIREAGSNGKKKRNFRYVLTPIGRIMAKIPVDPRISRMLIEARNEKCLNEISIIAAALSIQDPRERPMEKQEAADLAHGKFADPLSDFISLLNIWNRYQEVWEQNKSAGKLKRFCKEHFLSFKRMREWRDIYTQLAGILEEHEMPLQHNHLPVKNSVKKKDTAEPFSPLYAAIHRSILSGFLSNIAVRKDNNIFKAAKNREVMIFPGSSVFNRAGNWIVAAEMVETSRLFARVCGSISSHWLENLGKDLCRYVYIEPHWNKKRGDITAYEQVFLFGLKIVEKRPVSYGRINPKEASEIFIRNALVNPDVEPVPFFLKENQRRIGEIRQMENRLRRRDLLVSEEEMYRFYQSKLGNDIYNIQLLKQRIKKQNGDDFLLMSREDLINYEPDNNELGQFPKHLSAGDHWFDCEYRFDPGQETDGVTVKIPAPVAASVDSRFLDWHVPGLLSEKITALIRTLPKCYRKRLVPVADTVEIISREMPQGKGSLLTALSRFIFERFHVDIPVSAWDDELLDDHLKMRVAVTDPNGKTIRSGRDQRILTTDITNKTDSKEIAEARKAWEQDHITCQDFPYLPDTVNVAGKGTTGWILYPGLTMQNDKTVSLRLFTSLETAKRSHQKGVLALYSLYFSKDLKFLKKDLTLSQKTRQHAAFFGGPKAFENAVYQSVLKTLFQKNIRSKEQFEQHAATAKKQLFKEGIEQMELAQAVLSAYFQTRTELFEQESSNPQNSQVLGFCREMRTLLARLVPENFMELYSKDRLRHIPRYLEAISVRTRRGIINPEKDMAKANILTVFTDSLNSFLQALSPDASEEKRQAIESYFWLIEEFKVSLFAQELKTAVPVSEKRLKTAMEEIRRMI